MSRAKTLFLVICLFPWWSPVEILKQPKLSSRAGESSIFNIFEKMKQAKIAVARLQFLRDAWSENTVFSDRTLSIYVHFGSILGPFWIHFGPNLTQRDFGAREGRPWQQKCAHLHCKMRILPKIKKTKDSVERVNTSKTMLPCW